MVGGVNKLIAVEVESTQPFASVTTTVYEVGLEIGVTVILAEVAPVFQVYETPPAAVKVIESFEQTVVPPVIVGEGNGFTVTGKFAVSTHPPTSTIT